MTSRRTLQIGSIICTLLAFAAFTLMDSPQVADYSRTEDALNIGGYVLCAVALALFFNAVRFPK